MLNETCIWLNERGLRKLGSGFEQQRRKIYLYKSWFVICTEIKPRFFVFQKWSYKYVFFFIFVAVVYFV